MALSKTAQRYQTYYEKGQWSITMLQNLLEKGKITQEECDEIVGEADE